MDPIRMLFATLYAGATTSHGKDAEEEFELGLPFSTVSCADWAASVMYWLKDGVPVLLKQPERPCPACGATQPTHAFTSYDGHPFSECTDCGCWYVPFIVDNALYERFFQQCPAARDAAQRPIEQRSSPQNLEADLQRIGSYLDRLLTCFDSANRRYLDIGAGTGASLIAASNRGMVAAGIEVDERAAEVARARGLDVGGGTAKLSSGQFDLITLWESLEHIANPLEVLTDAARRLAPGGLIAITLPNRDSPMATFMRGDCPFLGGGAESPGHINVFGVSQLRRLFERSGLALLATDAQYGTNIIELAGYLLGRHHGASTLLQNQSHRYVLPSTLARALNSSGPVWSLIEREYRLSPILFAVACAKSDVERLGRPLPINEGVKMELDQQLTQMHSGILDYATHVERLRSEVEIRDKMLKGLESTQRAVRSLIARVRNRIQ